MLVHIDSHEKADVIEMLRKNIQGADVVVEEMEVGDIYLDGANKKILIERKTAQDYISSIQDGRLYRQVKAMSLVGGVSSMVIIEGAQEIAKYMRFRKMPYYRVLTTEMWMAEKKVSVIKTFRPTDLVYLINRVIRKDAEGGDSELGSLQLQIQMKNPYRKKSVQGEAYGVLCSVKGIGPQTARKALRKMTLYQILKGAVEPKDGPEIIGISEIFGKAQIERLKEVLGYREEEEGQ